MTVSPECGFPSSLQVYRHPLASYRAAPPGLAAEPGLGCARGRGPEGALQGV